MNCSGLLTAFQGDTKNIMVIPGNAIRLARAILYMKTRPRCKSDAHFRQIPLPEKFAIYQGARLHAVIVVACRTGQLSEEEKARRLAEMSGNADAHEDARWARLQAARKRDDTEAEQELLALRQKAAASKPCAYRACTASLPFGRFILLAFPSTKRVDALSEQISLYT